jgi:hypothetical protein
MTFVHVNTIDSRSDSNLLPQWAKQRGNRTQMLAKQFLIINRIKTSDLAHYRCLQNQSKFDSFIHIDVNRRDLLKHRLPVEHRTSLMIEFLSSINQLKLDGHIRINCSSSDGTSVRLRSLSESTTKTNASDIAGDIRISSTIIFAQAKISQI